ncbi:MAG: hypothetical protein WCO60_10785 [Verrucomicrobiota bacterium]
MKSVPRHTLLILTGSLVTGGVIGHYSPTRDEALADTRTHQLERVGGEGFIETSNLKYQSETKPFHTLDIEKQAAFLNRLSLNSTDNLPTSTIVLLARMISTLSGDQVEELLKGHLSEKIEQEEIRRMLVERLADLDPQRAFDVAQNLGDKNLLVHVLCTVSEQDLTNALQLAQGLSKERAQNVLVQFFQEIHSRPISGSAPDAARALAALPAFKDFDFKNDHGRYVGQTIGHLIAETAKTDPTSAIATVKNIVAELTANRKQDGDSSFPQDRILKSMLNGVLTRLREESPQAASALFSAIPDTSKAEWWFNWEALSLVQTGAGVDAAIAFAEKQKEPVFIKEAATGTWMGLALNDRQSAFEWIESLPKGPFRDGVFAAVQWEAVSRSFAWGSPAASIAAGASLLSEQSQMDYYAVLISSGRFGGIRPRASELIPQLPISDNQKQELYRRFAPIKTN